MKRTTRVVARGFTLIEVAIATAIIGIGVAALMVAMSAGTRANKAGNDLTQAVFLAQEVRERTLSLPFDDPDSADAATEPGPNGTSPQTFVDDLNDLMDVTYTPPRDGRGNPITELSQWSQEIKITWVQPNSLTTEDLTKQSDVVRVDVTILKSQQEISKTSWLVTRR